MKTKEFIKRVEELGYKAIECNYWIDVKHTSWGLKATVFTESSRLSLITNDMNLIKLCIEYTETPPEEREEEKRYKVQLPDPERVAVNFIALRKDDGKISLWSVYKMSFESDPSFHLTESEIKRNHEYLWQFAKEVKE